MFNVTCLDKYGNTVTNLTQWDLNQTLYIEDHGFTTAPFFHFCNKNSEKALVVASTMGTDGVLMVHVPNSLLIEPYNITAYVYLTEDDSSKTVEVIQLPVRQRPIPDSYEYVDDPVVIDLTTLVAEIKELNSEITLAENERITAETIRINNENERIANENARISAENTRVSSETERVEAEERRLSSEKIRKGNEDERIASELLREGEENTRKTNEDNRISAETDRTTAENERITSETARKDAEELRIEAENTRVTAENERVSAEEIRQSQEAERQTNTATAIQNADNATTRANLAAEACEDIVAGTGFISVTEKGIAGGVATLDDTGKVPLEQLPDDIGGDEVPEGVTYISFDSTGEEVGDILPVDADTLGGNSADYFTGYTDTKIADLINGAPTTLDTLKEIADAMAENEDVVASLNEAIGKKANASDLTSHTGNTSNPHGVTKSQVGLENVPNVATNDQTPTYSVASANAELTSGEKLSVAFGKIAKAIKSLISHLADTTSHVSSTEKSTWNGKANASHGNHVPITETANNSKFLRNDNTWATVTPANIGAASSSHNQAASTITAGTLGGKVNANASAMATLTNAQVRDMVVLDSDPGEGASVSYNPGTIVWSK